VIDEAHVRPPLRALSKEARDLVDGALKEGGFL
jgi:dihydrodipicolinate synthase/N-acetylneuraminate lyase